MEKERPSSPLEHRRSPHRALIHRYRAYGSLQSFRISAVSSIILFAAGVYLNYLASDYATAQASNSVTDIILSNTPALDVDALFVYGAVALIGFITLLCLWHPKRIPFTLYSLGAFFIIRAGFISLTHIAPFPVHTPIQFTSDIGIFFSKLFFGDDLFFSGHTGVPFLMALLYWRDRVLRSLFLAWSIVLALVVLLGHIHYSIDVVSAYFITYTIYAIASWLFPKDHELFLHEEIPLTV